MTLDQTVSAYCAARDEKDQRNFAAATARVAELDARLEIAAKTRKTPEAAAEAVHRPQRRPAAAAKFDAHFERMWDGAQPMDEFRPAINALEPK